VHQNLCIRGCRYQSYHRGIETSLYHIICVYIAAINRTIVELKQINGIDQEAGKFPINRTIVELKRIMKYELTNKGTAINRTIVELKPRTAGANQLITMTINRTIVELKRGS